MTGLVLIVNADDYGLDPGVNRAIERAHREGVVTSTSVMANCEAAPAAGLLGEVCPGLGVGIHLTLTAGTPVSPLDEVRTLVDADGRLLARAELLSRLKAGGIDDAEVVAECTAQVGRLRSFGVEPDHWDVHQHLQEYRRLTGPIAAAMRNEGVLRARNPARLRLGAARIDPRLAYEDVRRGPGARFLATHFTAPDGLFDARPSRWARAVPRLPNGVVEAICHPVEAPGPGARASELEALCAPDLRAALDRRGATLATFAEALPLPEPT